MAQTYRIVLTRVSDAIGEGSERTVLHSDLTFDDADRRMRDMGNRRGNGWFVKCERE